MAVIIKGSRKLIIDRTIPEVIKMNKNARREDLAKLCIMLSQLGADLLEINRTAFEVMGALPEGVNFIYRVENEKDVEVYTPNDFKYCIFDFKQFSHRQYENSKEKLKDINTIIELGIDEAIRWSHENAIKSSMNFHNIYGITVHGMNQISLTEKNDHIQQLRDKLDVKVGTCPDNRYFQAAALAVETITDDTDFVVAAFAGAGGQYGYAALEEILVGLKIVMKLEVEGDTTRLPEISELYQKLVHINITRSKAILGQDIFNYESGIHADGIEKDPRNYEPFNPEIVGQKRKLVLGKHSGTRAVVRKIEELGLNNEDIDICCVIEKVREKSIALRREIYDDELIQICDECMVNSLSQAM